MSTRPLIISHAACAGHAPENTLAGLRLALHMGVDGIEVDVRASADGVPVLMHDATVDRTTDGQGEVSALTLAELRDLDAGAKAPDAVFRGERVPTLAEVLEAIAGRALLVAEIKQGGVEGAVLEAVRQADALAWAMTWSFDWGAVAQVRQLEPRLPCCLLVPQAANLQPAVNHALTLGAQGLAVEFPALGADSVRKAHLRGLSVYAWTADRAPDVRGLIEAGVDGIVTNLPNTALSVLRSVGWTTGAYP
jgi:glycerophosphoryl diester phosphodiesterase